MLYDIIIIGNGILALSTAFSINQLNPQLKLAIVGPNDFMNGATVAAGAMLNCFSEVTQNTFINKYTSTKFEMAYNSLKLWPEWLKNINSFLSLSEQITVIPGTYTILNSKSGVLDSQNFTSILQALKQYNEKFEEIDAQDIPGLNPIEDCRPLKALYLPNESAINPSELTNALIKILSKNSNIKFINEKVKKINIEDVKAVSISTTNQQILGSKFLLATGSYTQTLLDQIPELSTTIPKIFSGVGYSLIIEQDNKRPISSIIRSTNRAGACGLHALPQGDDLYIGASNNLFLMPESNVSAGLAHFILECAIEQINQDFSASRIIKWHTGNRPVTLDTLPLIGNTNSINNLFLLTGTYRDGVHQSPLLAKYMAHLIVKNEEIFEHPFWPERKCIKIFDINTSVEEGIIHYLSGGYERGMKLPKAGWDYLLRDMIKQRLAQLYEDLETDYGLTADFLMMFEFAVDRKSLIQYFKEVLAIHTK